MRIDRTRYDRAIFPHVAEVATRFTDLDGQGHINNAAAAVLIQEARVSFNRRLGLAGFTVGGLRAMVASLHIEFAAELRHEPVTIATGVLAVGRTSVTLAQRATQAGQPALYGETVMVAADAGGPVVLSDQLRAALDLLALG